jgi:RNA polymerase sigma-70 factor (ECF subfamily)
MTLLFLDAGGTTAVPGLRTGCGVVIVAAVVLETASGESFSTLHRRVVPVLVQRQVHSVKRGPLSLGLGFEQVLTAAGQGAGWAFSRLYEWLAPSVAGYARAQGATEPEDLTSDVFLAAFSNLGSFAGSESQFRSWVFTIAHRRIIDDRRARARRPPPRSVEAEPPHLRSSAAGSAEEDALDAMGMERVRELLQKLAPDQRDVIALRVIADLSVEQAAAALGKQPGAIKALQRRALASLRRQLSAEGVSS